MYVIKNIKGGYYRKTNYHSGLNRAFRFESKQRAESTADGLNQALTEPIFEVKELEYCKTEEA